MNRSSLFLTKIPIVIRPNETTTTVVEDIVPSRSVQFWTILLVQIPSLMCTFYLLFSLVKKKSLRQALHNHVVIILLSLCFIIQLIDNPLYLDAYLYNGRNSFLPSPIICLIWWLIDYGVYGATTVFFAWAAFERHLLIFHHQYCFTTRRKRILFHYLPLTIISLYLLGFYLGVIIFPPCENSFDYSLEACGASPCYEEIPWLNIWDYLINGTVCTLIEAIASVLLLIRIISYQYRLRQPCGWKRNRKLARQILSISALSLSITLPQTLIMTIRKVVPGMNDFATDVSSYYFFFTTFVVLFLPFVCLSCLSELWPQRWKTLRKQHQPTVIPIQISVAQQHSPSFLTESQQRVIL